MKVLHEEIQFCFECPYCRYVRGFAYYECVKVRENVDKIICGGGVQDFTQVTPPDWCPLPDN